MSLDPLQTFFYYREFSLLCACVCVCTCAPVSSAACISWSPPALAVSFAVRLRCVRCVCPRLCLQVTAHWPGARVRVCDHGEPWVSCACVKDSKVWITPAPLCVKTWCSYTLSFIPPSPDLVSQALTRNTWKRRARRSSCGPGGQWQWTDDPRQGLTAPLAQQLGGDPRVRHWSSVIPSLEVGRDNQEGEGPGCLGVETGA